MQPFLLLFSLFIFSHQILNPNIVLINGGNKGKIHKVIGKDTSKTLTRMTGKERCIQLLIPCAPTNKKYRTSISLLLTGREGGSNRQN